jgi:hypothetical protein
MLPHVGLVRTRVLALRFSSMAIAASTNRALSSTPRRDARVPGEWHRGERADGEGARADRRRLRLLAIYASKCRILVIGAGINQVLLSVVELAKYGPEIAKA